MYAHFVNSTEKMHKKDKSIGCTFLCEIGYKFSFSGLSLQLWIWLIELK